MNYLQQFRRSSRSRLRMLIVDFPLPICLQPRSEDEGSTYKDASSGEGLPHRNALIQQVPS